MGRLTSAASLAATALALAATYFATISALYLRRPGTTSSHNLKEATTRKIFPRRNGIAAGARTSGQSVLPVTEMLCATAAAGPPKYAAARLHSLLEPEALQLPSTYNRKTTRENDMERNQQQMCNRTTNVTGQSARNQNASAKCELTRRSLCHRATNNLSTVPIAVQPAAPTVETAARLV
jgi:hypothetical protein